MSDVNEKDSVQQEETLETGKETKETSKSAKESKTDKKAKGKDTKVGKDGKPKKKNRVVGFFKDCKSELKKIVWPTKKQVVNHTIVVIIMVIIVGVFIWGLDLLLTTLFGLISNVLQ